MIEFAVRKPVAILMLCIGIVVLGLISARRIPMQLLPAIVTPEYTIVTSYPGATPQEVEASVTAPIERAVSTVAGLRDTRSSSIRERSEIQLKFSTEVDLLDTLSMLREKLDGVYLPDGAGKPKLARFATNSEPLLRVAFHKTNAAVSDLEAAASLTDILERRIEAVEGVALATLLGKPVRTVLVEVNPIASQTYEIPAAAVAQAIQAQNRSFDVGEIRREGRRTSLRLGVAPRSLTELGDVVVKKDGPRLTRLRDVATISDVVQPPEVRTHLQGEPSFVLEVQKEAEANSVRVSGEVKRTVQSFLAENADRFTGRILFDEGFQIEAAVDNVADAVYQGALLASLCIFLLIQLLWPTFVVVLAIPLSLMITLILMHFTGISYNLMSLAGLALGVGMLVDNSTNVLQNINLEAGDTTDAREAALQGTRKVSGAITASTLSTVAVFGPLAFVEGRIGQMFRDVAATMVFSLAASLFVAIVVIPMLSSVELKPRSSRSGGEWRGDALFSRSAGFYELRSGWRRLYAYPKDFFRKNTLVLLACAGWAADRLSIGGTGLRHWLGVRADDVWARTGIPFLARISGGVYALEALLRRMIPATMADSRNVLRAALLVTAAGGIFLVARGAELFPEEVSNRIRYEVDFNPGQTLDVTEKRVSAIEHELLKLPRVESVSSVVGARGSNVAELQLKTRPEDSPALARLAGRLLGGEPGVRFNRLKDGLFGDTKPVQVEIYNEDLQQLKERTTLATRALEGLPGLTDVENGLLPDIPEVAIGFLKRKLDWYEVDATSFATPLRSLLRGEPAGTLQLGGEELPVRVVSPPGYLNSVDRIRYFSVQRESKRVYLSEVSNVKEESALGGIHRINRRRVETISASLNGMDLQAASRGIQRALGGILKGSGTLWHIGGQDEERGRSQKSLIAAVLLSVLLVYLLLAAQFESLLQPAIILMTVPLCLSGVALFLLLFHLNVSALVFVGFVILVGTSVNSSILLVDFANQLRLGGMSVREALTEAAVLRMKPILVTTATNIFGLLPMALASGQGSSMQNPLAVTIMGGLLSSTILTMVVVPVIYEKLARRSHGAESP